MIRITVLLAFPALAAGSDLIWTGIPSQGTGQFKLVTSEGNCGEGTITAVTDPERGSVWRYHKPPGGNRCENHGIRVDGEGFIFREGSTYWFGWWSKLSTTANNNANFQWKSLGSGHLQNYPIILKMIGGRMHLQYRAPGRDLVTVWSAPMAPQAWHHYALGLHLSKDAAAGWIEFAFDGVRQRLTNGSDRYPARTFDTGDHNCPKWGIYGGQGTDMTNWIDDLKVGTDYASVAREGLVSAVRPPAREFRDFRRSWRFDLRGRALYR